MPQREWQMDKQLVRNALRRVVFLDDIIDMGYSARDQQAGYEGDDVVVGAPSIDIDRVKDDEGGESPADSVNND